MFFGRVVSMGGFKLAKFRGRFDAYGSYGLQLSPSGAVRVTPGFSWAGTALMILVFLLALVLAALVVAPQAGQSVSDVSALGLSVLGTAVAERTGEKKSPPSIRKMEADIKALAKELEAGQVEMAAGIISQERGEELEAKAKEMEELQEHVDRYNRIAGATSKARQMDRVTLPSEREDVQRKTVRTTPGHLFVASEALKRYKQDGKHGWSQPVSVGNRFGRFVKLRGEEAIAFEKKAFDAATLSDLGTDAIITIDRDPELVRFEEPEILTLRDMFTNTTTTSDSIKFVRHVATTRGAASVAKAGLKPFLKVTFSPETTPVQTIAVLSKVTEQDIDDAPRLVGFINGEMTLDVKVEEEKQLAWGDGTGNNLIGLFDPSIGIPEFNRSSLGDTKIDTLRRMRTDLRKFARVQPNFAAIDPLDWEEIELEKGTDERYVWGLIQDLRGPRIWSVRVVESDGMTNPETGERRMLMGDGVRGATIYDRMAIQLAVGFMDDDFGRNLRTLRAEERLAFAVKRAFAFTYTTTEEASS